MLVVEASAHVTASVDEVLDFVMDIERYKEADHKIRRIKKVRRQGNEVLVTMVTVTRGMPVIASQKMVLTPGHRIDVTNKASFQDRLVTFHGGFTAKRQDNGAFVTHRYEFDCKGIGRLIVPILGKWLQRDIEEEVERLRVILSKAF